MKNIFPLFGILTVMGIGIAMLQMLKDVKSIPLTIGIMAGSTVIVGIITFALYKMGIEGVEEIKG